MDEAFDHELVAAIAESYDELELGFRRTHLPPIGTTSNEGGFSSIHKVSIGIVCADQVVGKCVVTSKRGGRLKLGPVYIRPTFRGDGLASHVLRSLVAVADNAGFRTFVATVPSASKRARRVLLSQGFLRSHSLRAHYSAGADEDVFALSVRNPSRRGTCTAYPAADLSDAERRIVDHVHHWYFPLDEPWLRWISNSTAFDGLFRGRPQEVIQERNDVALLIYKRGGAVKVVPAAGGSDLSAGIVPLWEHIARLHGRRKVTVFWPSAVGARPRALGEYFLEGRLALGQYALGTQVELYSRLLG
jgi:RimJ/RimL family protein N-acetyltransferase